MTAGLLSTWELANRIGECVVEVGYSDMAEQINMVESVSRRGNILRLRVVDGRYAGQQRNLDLDDKRKWILSSDLRDMEAITKLDALKGKKVRMEDEDGQIIQGLLEYGGQRHVVLTTDTAEIIKDGISYKPQGYVILGLGSTNPDKWHEVNEA